MKLCSSANHYTTASLSRKLRNWSHLLKKSLMENFIFYAVIGNDSLTFSYICRNHLNNHIRILFTFSIYIFSFIFDINNPFFIIWLPICLIYLHYTAWKVPKYGPEKTPYLDTFHAVLTLKTFPCHFTFRVYPCWTLSRNNSIVSEVGDDLGVCALDIEVV